MTAPPPQPARRTAARAHAALLFMVLIWGVNFPIAKAALSQLDPLAFNALRFPLAALVVLVAMLMGGKFTWPAPGERLPILALGVLGNVFYQLCFIYGLQLTQAGTASVLLAGTPVLTALLSAALGHEKISARTWIGVGATVAGIGMVVFFGGIGEGRSTLAGDALMLGASISWAVYTVGSRQYIDRYGSVQYTAWTLWIAAIGLCIIGIPAVMRADLGAVTPGAWVGVVYAGALSIGLGYLIWYYGVGKIGNTRTSAYSNLTPVVALIASWAALGEVPAPGQLAGAAVIIAGITLAQRRSRPTPA